VRAVQARAEGLENELDRVRKLLGHDNRVRSAELRTMEISLRLVRVFHLAYLGAALELGALALRSRRSAAARELPAERG
jgi:hypothetical protein